MLYIDNVLFGVAEFMLIHIGLLNLGTSFTHVGKANSLKHSLSLTRFAVRIINWFFFIWVFVVSKSSTRNPISSLFNIELDIFITKSTI